MPLPAGTAPLPDPDALHPLPAIRKLAFLRPLLALHPEITNVEVGAYSYYDDAEDPLPFFRRNIRYNYGFSGARLVIGRYCALAHGTTFIMPDANHATAGPTTFPFAVFGGAWAEALPISDYSFPARGDTVVGHDVWFGTESLVLPGLRIGHGAVIAARSVVTRDVPDYAVVAGNPARVVRRRYPEEESTRLVALGWWDWPAERVARAIPLLVKGSVAELEEFAAREGDGGAQARG